MQGCLDRVHVTITTLSLHFHPPTLPLRVRGRCGRQESVLSFATLRGCAWRERERERKMRGGNGECVWGGVGVGGSATGPVGARARVDTRGFASNPSV